MAGNGSHSMGNGENSCQVLELTDRVCLATQPLRVIRKLFELLYERNRDANAAFVEIEPQDLDAITITLADAMDRLEGVTEK